VLRHHQQADRGPQQRALRRRRACVLAPVPGSVKGGADPSNRRSCLRETVRGRRMTRQNTRQGRENARGTGDRCAMAALAEQTEASRPESRGARKVRQVSTRQWVGKTGRVPSPETLYATTSDGLSVAYQVFGSGRRNFVVVPGIVSHVEMGWENPGLSHLWRRLRELGRVALFDKRGTGMSDHSVGAAPLDQRLDDLHAVMDAAGMPEAAVCGISEGGALAVLFAATFPERVTHLLLHGCLAVGALAENHPSPERAQAAAPMILEAIASTWGTGSGGGSIFVKGAPNDAERTARYERYSCPPSTAVELMRINLGVDLRPILHAVTVRTLVTHCSHDPAVPVWHGRLVAGSIEGARFVEIEGDWHTSWNPNDMGVLADLFEEFVTGRPAREQRRHGEPSSKQKSVRGFWGD
jgi:pimeloyl-ACP methyl ester carboxylesterase